MGSPGTISVNFYQDVTHWVAIAKVPTTKWRRNIAENFNRPSTCWVGRTNVTDRQTDRQTDDRQTDGRAMTYSERELEFTFAKKPVTVTNRTSLGSQSTLFLQTVAFLRPSSILLW